MSGAVVELLSNEASLIAQAPEVPAEEGTLRVLHVHSGNIYGGVETMLLTYARENSCPAMTTSFALCFDGRLKRELKEAAADVHTLNEVRIRNPLSLRRVRRGFKRLLQTHSFDVVVTHSSWSHAIFGPAVRAAGLPLVFYLHNPADGRHWLERMARRTVPDLVLSNSRFTATSVSKIYPDVRSQVVHCPVAPPEPSESSSDIARTRAELQTPDDATVIIQVSRMESWKGHAQLLEALSLLKDIDGWVCWQVGGAQRPSEETYLNDLKALAGRLGVADRVRFLDQRSDVAKLLAAADIFCQPNTAPEPFGIALIEALYARLPVVATNIGAVMEIVDASCGLLVPPYESHALSVALHRLIEDRELRARLGASGPTRAGALCHPATQLNYFHGALTSIIPPRQETQ